MAVATVHGMRYLVTWNCAHLANAEMLEGVNRILKEQGFDPPVVCIPEELMGV